MKEVVTQASYLNLLEDNRLKERIEEAKKHLSACNLCPHDCGVNRKEKYEMCLLSKLRT